MPFAVFRQHQRKLMAIFGILAMFGFALSGVLPNLFDHGRDGRGGANDPVVAVLKWRTLRSSDLLPMKEQRARANTFVSALKQYPQVIPVFGGLTSRELVDAIIFEHKAIELGMPATPDLANRWLQQVITGGVVNARFIEDTFRRSQLSEQVSDEQLLLEIANQIRIRKVQALPSTADATPYDVFDAFKSQEERVSAYAAGVKVEDFVAAVPNPSEADIDALFQTAKGRLPDPNRPDPGFKVPQKTKFEMVSADLDALMAAIQAKLTTADLREIYDTRKVEFPGPEGELPHSLFAGAPELTKHDAFPDVRAMVARTVANERARDEVDAKFEDFKNNVMGPFQERYYDSGAGSKSKGLAPGDLLKNAAVKAGLTYESTPLVPASTPDLFGPIAKSHRGSDRAFDAVPFASLAFSPRTDLYVPMELSDAKFLDEGGHRFLAWKIQDEPERIPSLAEVREDVVRAWKIEKARPLAEAEANKLKVAVDAVGGGAKIRDAAGKRPVITTEPRARLVPAPMTNINDMGQMRLSEIVEIPHAGEAIREAIFGLDEKTAAVAPDATKSVYYVLSLRSRMDAEFDALYAFGAATSLYRTAANEAGRQVYDEWRQSLRKQAGLAADWSPPGDAP